MPTVLITGAARGIGRAAAERLAGAGWNVVAGVRSPDDAQPLIDAHPGRVTAVTLDVTDEAHVAGLDGSLPATLDAVVNNAGIAVGAPVEALPVSELRRQLEVNIIGQVAVTQAVLPRLRASRGRVVFVSSVSGLVSTPMFGAYCASKFGIEAVADALRMEVAPWGIRVSLVEPAQTDTDIWRQADAAVEEALAQVTPAHRELYAKHIDGFRKSIPRSQRMAAPVEGVAEAIEKALTARRPRARYIVGAQAKLSTLLAALTPTPVLDQVLRAGTGVPRRP
jgi:NAD(P)-dependent dehydrogenase (short-subunit alcohol dehydrogenase family)